MKVQSTTQYFWRCVFLKKMFEIDHFPCLKKQLFSIKELAVDVFWGKGGKDEKPLQVSAFGYTENLLYF